MFGWFSQDSASPAQLDDDVESAFSELNDFTPQLSDTGPDDDVPSTHLPTLAADSNSKDLPRGLVRSASTHLTPQARSAPEKKDILIESWATLLHAYTVAEDVAFVVVGLTTPQLVVSHCPTAARSLALQSSLRITSVPFDTSKHRDKVNTTVNFGTSDDLIHESEYILQWSGDDFSDIQLYSEQSTVPQKFARAVWSTFVDISASTGDAHALGRFGECISRADRKAISSWVSDPIFEVRSCLHHLFLNSAKNGPKDAAVHAWDGSLTYAKLNLLSDRVACRLLEKGLRRGQYVPFSFEKSMWMVVAVLGILKAGGAMVPIDPSQPQARVQEIIKQTSASLVVVSASQVKSFANAIDTFEVSHDTLRGDGADFAQDHHVLPQMRAEEPALVLFTSGSTGKPKGIVIEHGAISTRMLVEGRAFQYSRARTLQFAATTWDIFMTDVFTTLTYQGCICIPDEQDRRTNLARFCKEFNVALALMTPTLATILEPTAFPTLRTLIFGGEALRQDVVDRWSIVNGPKLYQGYGPAETGPSITGRVAERPEVLGNPLDNSLCILVDPNDHEKLVPLGAIGELVVGGPSLLREYIGDSRATNSAVIVDPSWARGLDIANKRFYKTGDLLRYSIDTLDGQLDFVGRKDDQVKYHGQRIELKEIEHHLTKIHGVESCAVTLVGKGCFKDRLVAVVQVTDHQAVHGSRGAPSILQHAGVTYSDMKSFLSSRLPEYMIPNELIAVDSLPHSSSMKLDRLYLNKWLSDMQKVPTWHATVDQIDTNKLHGHENTATAIAAEYARIVAGSHEARGLMFKGHDFNLQSGGIDSVQIMSLSWYLTRRYGVQIPIAEILSSKATVRTLASMIDAQTGHCSMKEQVKHLDVRDEVIHQTSLLSLEDSPHYENPGVHRVFVTGASGYLGIEILKQLLSCSRCQIYALLRGSSPEDARNRLIVRAQASGWWQPVYMSRINVWIGDLAQKRLGLAESQWAMLQASTSPAIDAIIHNGAKVNYNMDYESLKATNVSSTVELLKAVRCRQQPLHSFVFVSGGQELTFDERDTTKAANESGYARSKVVSELIVKKFAKQQVSKARHVRVVKPGFIIGDSKQGLANQGDFLWRLVAASIESRHYNEDDSKKWLFVADVSRVSRSVLDSVFEDRIQLVTQVLDGIRFEDLWAQVMFPLMYMLESNNASLGVEGGPSQPTPGVGAAIQANITHLIETGFLPRPSRVVNSKDRQFSAMDAFDVDSVRKQFPALQQGIVPFNNAAGTALLQAAIDKTQWYMSSLPIELGRDDPESKKKTERLGENYKELAAFMNADADEIGMSVEYEQLPGPALTTFCP
jgi:amino acid adenylation domain-containing protein/thioester reductase-like protein